MVPPIGRSDPIGADGVTGCLASRVESRAQSLQAFRVENGVHPPCPAPVHVHQREGDGQDRCERHRRNGRSRVEMHPVSRAEKHDRMREIERKRQSAQPLACRPGEDFCETWVEQEDRKKCDCRCQCCDRDRTGPYGGPGRSDADQEKKVPAG